MASESMSHTILWPLNHSLKIFYVYALNVVSCSFRLVFTFGVFEAQNTEAWMCVHSCCDLVCISLKKLKCLCDKNGRFFSPFIYMDLNTRIYSTDQYILKSKIILFWFNNKLIQNHFSSCCLNIGTIQAIHRFVYETMDNGSKLTRIRNAARNTWSSWSLCCCL